MKRLTKLLILALVCGCCLVGVSLTQHRLDVIKEDKQLVNTLADERMTPRMAITVGALGAFRGIIADLLFLRMNAEKEKGNYFELMQLGELIVQLQPDMPGAITFIAWNMAYNVSVTFTAHEDRWRWVQRGIEMIRDEALKYNPDDPEVHHQLAWIYQHKVGQILDDANRYYKGQLARQLIGVLGNSDSYEWDRLAAAPDDEDGLRRMLGRRRLGKVLLDEEDADVEAIAKAVERLAALQEQNGKIPDDALQRIEKGGVRDDVLRAVFAAVRAAEARRAGFGDKADALMKTILADLQMTVGLHSEFYRILETAGTTYRRLEEEFRLNSGLPDGLREKFEAAGLAEDLDFYFRSKWLRDVHKLDSDRIAELNEQFGYLDFRLPEAHAIYWADRGLQHSPNHTNLNRIIAHSSARSVKAGRLRHLTEDGYAVVMPNLDNVDVVKQMYIDNLSKFENSTGYLSGFENWVKDTIVVLYMWGKEKKAAEYMQFLRSYEHFQNRPEYKLSATRFALKLAAEDIGDKSDKQVAAMMFGVGVQHIEALAYQNYDRAEITLRILKRIRQRYYEDIDRGKRIEERKQLPTVTQVLIEAKRYLLRFEPHPELRRAILSVGPELPAPPDAVRRPGAAPDNE